jgi:hypothetical protein
MSEWRVEPLLYDLNPDKFMAIIDDELRDKSAADYVDGLDAGYRERQLHGQLMRVIGLEAPPDMQKKLESDSLESERIAVFRGALLGFAGVELIGHGWIIDSPAAIPPEMIAEPLPPADQGRFRPGFIPAAVDGMRELKHHHLKFHEWGEAALNTPWLTSQFITGLVFAFAVSRQAYTERIKGEFKLLQADLLPSEEWDEIERIYVELFDDRDL